MDNNIKDDATILLLHEILGQMREINIRFNTEQQEALARLEMLIAKLRRELNETATIH